MVNNKLKVILVIVLLTFSQVVQAQDMELAEPNSHKFFSPFYDRIIMEDGGIIKDISNIQSSSINTARDSGLTLVTLMKLFDLYQSDSFLESAKKVSDYLTTALQDPRYQLFATYHERSSDVLSNYRSSIDNLLIAWGLYQLSNRIESDDPLAVKIQQERLEFIQDDLDVFLRDNGIPKQLRVDQGSLSQQQSQIYDVYSNLYNAFIISESNSDIFNIFEDKPEEIFNFVEANATDEEGGVHTVVYNGVHDNIVTLTNTVLYANLALNLYSISSDTNFLNISINTMNYIQDTFYDIGVTGGYFETVIDGTPVQQSKSLFAHALLLNLLMGLANQGIDDARLNLLALWRTINNYFRETSYFLSTINRGGKASSSTVNTEDNLMMIYAMSSLPLFSTINYTKTVEFRDTINIDTIVQVPPNLNSQLILTHDGETVQTVDIAGENEKQTISLEFDPPRPSDDSEVFAYKMELKSEGVITDQVDFTVTVKLSPGVSLTPGVITIVSVMAIVIFALFVKNYGDMFTEENE